MKSIDLFPTSIFATCLAGHEEQNPQMLAVVQCTRAQSPGVVRSNIGSAWHSDGELVYNEAFVPTVALITKLANAAAHALGFDAELVSTNAWVVVAPKGSGNSKHNHPGALLSAAYYIKAPPGSSPLVFHDPRATRVFSEPVGKQATPHNSNESRFEVLDGVLFLFPAWLEHSVPLNNTDEERVVLSINYVTSSRTI